MSFDASATCRDQMVNSMRLSLRVRLTRLPAPEGGGSLAMFRWACCLTLLEQFEPPGADAGSFFWLPLVNGTVRELVHQPLAAHAANQRSDRVHFRLPPLAAAGKCSPDLICDMFEPCLGTPHTASSGCQFPKPSFKEPGPHLPLWLIKLLPLSGAGCYFWMPLARATPKAPATQPSPVQKLILSNTSGAGQLANRRSEDCRTQRQPSPQSPLEALFNPFDSELKFSDDSACESQAAEPAAVCCQANNSLHAAQ